MPAATVIVCVSKVRGSSIAACIVQYSIPVLIFLTGRVGIAHDAEILLKTLVYTGLPPAPAYSQSPATLLHVKLVVPGAVGSKLKCKVNKTSLLFNEKLVPLPS